MQVFWVAGNTLFIQISYLTAVQLLGSMVLVILIVQHDAGNSLCEEIPYMPMSCGIFTIDPMITLGESAASCGQGV